MHYSKKYYFIFLILLIAFACSKVPKRYIQPDEMKKIMWELMFADKKISNGGMNNNSIYVDSLSVEYSKVLAYHKISQKKFVESLKFYQANPELQKALYDSIDSYGNKLSQQVQEKIRKQDSIKLAKAAADTLPKSQTDTLKTDSLQQKKDSILSGKDSAKRKKVRSLPAVEP